MKTEVSKYSRLARTPPSTFLFLHLHLSNSPGSENPHPHRQESSISGARPRREAFRRPHSTANDNRWLSAVDSLILVRSFTGTKTCLGQGPRQRRAQWAVYKPAQSALSTVVVNKSSHHPWNLYCEEVSIFRHFAPYLSHNPATFSRRIGIESPDASGGCRRLIYLRGRRSSMNPSPVPCGRENIERSSHHCCS